MTVTFHIRRTRILFERCAACSKTKRDGTRPTCTVSAYRSSGLRRRQARAILMRGVRGAHKQPGGPHQQNWVGGSNLTGAVFIPPHPSDVPDLMSDLEKSLHDETVNVPHLVRIAISHYQFETIHPFLGVNIPLAGTVMALGSWQPLFSAADLAGSLVSLVVLAVALGMVIGAVRMTWMLSRSIILCAVVVVSMLIPFIGLLTLGLLDQRARQRYRKYGSVPVGLFGPTSQWLASQS